jgi:hypothetical protein
MALGLPQAGLDLGALLFADEADPVAVHAAGRVTGVVLTDHNRLASRQEALLPSVIDIVDHHVDEGAYPATARTRIELVGSCCTLVAQAMAASEACAGVMESPAVALLLQGAVLLDTAKLDPEQKRATAADHEVAATVAAAAAAAAGTSDRSVPTAVPLESPTTRPLSGRCSSLRSARNPTTNSVSRGAVCLHRLHQLAAGSSRYYLRRSCYTKRINV